MKTQKSIESLGNTLNDLFKVYLPQELEMKNNQSLLLKIDEYLFNPNFDKSILNEIREETNCKFSNALDDIKYLIDDCSISSYENLDSFFTAKKLGLKNKLDLSNQN